MKRARHALATSDAWRRALRSHRQVMTPNDGYWLAACACGWVGGRHTNTGAASREHHRHADDTVAALALFRDQPELPL